MRLAGFQTSTVWIAPANNFNFNIRTLAELFNEFMSHKDRKFMKCASRPEPKVNQTTIENTMNLGQNSIYPKIHHQTSCTYPTTKIECLCFSPNFPMAYFGTSLSWFPSACTKPLVAEAWGMGHQAFRSVGRYVLNSKGVRWKILGFNGKNQRVWVISYRFGIYIINGKKLMMTCGRRSQWQLDSISNIFPQTFSLNVCSVFMLTHEPAPPSSLVGWATQL